MGTSGVPANQRARELVLQISQLTVELAKVLGEPVDNDACPRGPHHITEHERGGKHMLCGACTCGGEGSCEWRVREKLFEAGAEAMRAACLGAVQAVLEREGLSDPGFKAAIEAAEP